VLIVGNGPSGWDITERVAQVASSVVVSVRRLPTTVNPGASRAVGLIEKYDWETRSISFHEGDVMHDVDVVVYCTGYQFNFPFVIKSLADQTPLFPPGFKVADLYEHMFYIPKPTLAFVGLPKMTATFIVAEAQSAVVARVFSGRIDLPERAEMRRWNQQYLVRHKRKSRSDANYHTLSTKDEEDKDYVNSLQRWSGQRGIAHNIGKPPPYWCNCLDSAKSSLREIRQAFKEEGNRSHRCKTYASLRAVLSIPCSRDDRGQFPQGAASCFLDRASAHR
jgi:cation diffusion facilitator CzcD-associated flavoprotein CzcO